MREVEGPAPWLDPDGLAAAMRRLPESLYARLFESRWTAAENRLASEEDIFAAYPGRPARLIRSRASAT